MAAANRGVLILSKDEIFLSPIVSQVVDENCDGCGYCIDPCPYNALSLIEYIKNGEIKKTVESNPFLCQGCGICQATCPKKGIYIPNHSLEQFSAMIDMALKLS
ncbi:MAG: 4Fe-4S dicluster domain-containing protein [Candidatus Desulfofervidus auxilii]|nr:4Fe-4S dicluster domain-containing protein [Candidatus Desulfofervidus auxilii]